VRQAVVTQVGNVEFFKDYIGLPDYARRSRVLVVEDNRDAAESMRVLLQLFGHQADVAFDGLQAIEKASEFRPAIILLDISLPKLDGYDTALRLRQQPWGKHIVLVALTGWGQEEDKRRTKAAGFDLHLVKPVDLKLLQEILSSFQPAAA
jgi:CheY-like chemotaxis protein